jgi:MoxR-like ATPase
MDIKEASGKIELLAENVEKVFVGKRETVELALTALFGGGHLLIIDLPGVGKTTLAKAIGMSIRGKTKRLQFTPDLLPSDVTGVSIYVHAKGEFEFHPGPVFTNILLADEINRATPRAQSSLLEAMEECQVSVDGKTYYLDQPFMVIATQNPIEVQGTFPLPEAQLDRFLISVTIGYPDRAREGRIMETRATDDPMPGLQPVMDLKEVEEIKRACRKVFIDPVVKGYILDIAEATRRRPEILIGASPRASVALLHAAQTRALLKSRDFVTPDDVKRSAAPVLAHRIILRSATRLNLDNNTAVVNSILSELPVPQKV